jgi:hypothetical protein
MPIPSPYSTNCLTALILPRFSCVFFSSLEKLHAQVRLILIFEYAWLQLIEHIVAPLRHVGSSHVLRALKGY